MKKILSSIPALTLVLAFILCMIPINAAAADGEPLDPETVEIPAEEPAEPAAEEPEPPADGPADGSDTMDTMTAVPMSSKVTILDVRSSELLNDALANTAEELVINLTASFNHQSPIDLGVNNQSITIDLRGHELTLNVEGTALTVRDGVSLTINGPGVFEVLSSGTSTTTYNRGIEVHGTGSILNITGAATVNATVAGISKGDWDGLAVFAYNGGAATVTNAYAYARDGIAAQTAAGGTITVLGNAMATGRGFSHGAYAWGGTINVNANASGSYMGARARDEGVVKITGNATGTGFESSQSYGAGVQSGGLIYVTGNIKGETNDIATDIPAMATRSVFDPSKTGITFTHPDYGSGYYWNEYRFGTSAVYMRQGEVDNSVINNFVANFYQVILGRAPSQAEVSLWAARLKDGTHNGVQIAYDFLLGDEIKSKNLSNSEYVETLYRAIFERASDAAGKKHWVDMLNEGYPREYVFAGFMDSEEFKELCAKIAIQKGEYKPPAGGEVYVFVTRLYRLCLGREPEPAGLNDWADKLITGKMTGTQVAQGFMFSEEMEAKKLGSGAFVDILYRAMMGREPDAAGRAAWIDRLDNDKKWDRGGVFKGFAESTEFRGICSRYGIKP